MTTQNNNNNNNGNLSISLHPRIIHQQTKIYSTFVVIETNKSEQQQPISKATQRSTTTATSTIPIINNNNSSNTETTTITKKSIDNSNKKPLIKPNHDENTTTTTSATTTNTNKSIIESVLLSEYKGTVTDTQKLAVEKGWEIDELTGVVKSLEVDGYIISTKHEEEILGLTPDGKNIIENGSPEFIFIQKIRSQDNGMSMLFDTSLTSNDSPYKSGYGQCIAKKWITRRKNDQGQDILELTSTAPTQDETKLLLEKFNTISTTSNDFKELATKRKLMKFFTRKWFSLVPGPNYAESRRVGSRAVADLTRQMLEDGTWETTTMKHNFHSMGVPVSGGTLHPLLKVRFEFRKILLGMGFEEMPTSKWVESSFWNFDSLFQPQQHPARDAHDTFFISGPAANSSLKSIPQEYINIVQQTHERGGGYGSIGYRYDWSLEEAKRNVLRTHTTAISSQMLYAIANQKGGFSPKKLFSIDRVFRNEAIDKTHLAEFHQVEGAVCDYNLTLGDLKGTIRAFFKAIGIIRIRFKAAYNPYTEPSMEIFGFHPQLKKWTEIGNSGMFRPEMLRPMGLPADVRVIAWGLSLERPTMIMTGEEHIKNLFGSGVSFEMMRAFPLARFKKDDESGSNNNSNNNSTVNNSS
jgi:phenylalanyl-tRNA synthetase alpha chain